MDGTFSKPMEKLVLPACIVLWRGMQGSIASSPTERTPSMRSKISGSPSVSTAEILVGWWRTSSVTGRRTPPISWESVSGLGSLPEGWPSSSRRKF